VVRQADAIAIVALPSSGAGDCGPLLCREAVAQTRAVVPPPQMSPGPRECDLMGGRLAASEASVHPICPGVVEGHWYDVTNNFRRVAFVRQRPGRLAPLPLRDENPWGPDRRR